MKKYSFVVLMFIASNYLLSQSLHTVTSGEEAKEIVIEESGIYAASKDIFDTITVDARNNDVMYGYADEVKSFWYKIYVTVDSKITFEIFPSKPGNRYNYFLYQRRGDLSINDVYTTDIAPVRANLYEDEMENGTGLSLSSNVSSIDSCPEDINKIWYHTPYQSAIMVSAGDVLLLNVYHVNGTDCGQHLILKNDKHAQKFQSVYETCYNDQLALKKVGNFSNMDILVADGKTKSLFIVRDSIRDGMIEGEMACVIIDSTIHTGTMVSNEIILEKNTAIKIIFVSLESQNKTPSFSAVQLNANRRIKIKTQELASSNKDIKASYNNKEEAGLVTAGMFSGNARKLSHSTENNAAENDSQITDTIIWASISGLALLIFLFVILDKKRRKEHSIQVTLTTSAAKQQSGQRV